MYLALLAPPLRGGYLIVLPPFRYCPDADELRKHRDTLS